MTDLPDARPGDELSKADLDRIGRAAWDASWGPDSADSFSGDGGRLVRGLHGAGFDVRRRAT